MKKWNTPAISELNINETAYHLTGNMKDGGEVGDGILSGHNGWDLDGDGKCDCPWEGCGKGNTDKLS